MGSKITMVVLVVTAYVSTTAVYALDPHGVTAVKVDIAQAVGIMVSESGKARAMMVGPGGSATYYITDPSNPVLVPGTVDGVVEQYWNYQSDVTLASIDGESYAVVAIPTDVTADVVVVVQKPAPTAGRMEQSEPEPPVTVCALSASVTSDRSVMQSGDTTTVNASATVECNHDLTSLVVVVAVPAGLAVAIMRNRILGRVFKLRRQ